LSKGNVRNIDIWTLIDSLRVSKESIVDITGTITKAPEKIESTTQSDVEIQISSFFVVSAAEALPLQIEDAARPKSILKAQVCIRIMPSWRYFVILGRGGRKNQRWNCSSWRTAQG
jgi:hypothetical protein